MSREEATATAARLRSFGSSSRASVPDRFEGIGENACRRVHQRPERAQTAAVILAAGRGWRMGGMTEDRPKCLLPVGGQTVIEHQLATLSALGVAKITIVTGYGSDQVRERVNGRASFIENDVWADTNSLYSLALCRDAVCSSATPPRSRASTRCWIVRWSSSTRPC